MKFLKRFFRSLLVKTPAYKKVSLLEETLAQKEELLLKEIAKLHQENEKRFAAAEQRNERLVQELTGKVQQLEELLKSQHFQHGEALKNEMTTVAQELQQLRLELGGAVSEVESRLLQTVNDRVDQLGAHVQNQTGLVTSALQTGKEESTATFQSAVSEVESRLLQTVNDRVDQLGSCVQNQSEAVTHAVSGQLQLQQQENLNVFRQAAAQNGHIEKESLSVLFKNDIECRWQILDALDHLLYPGDFPVSCTVCHHTDRKDSYRTCVTHCRFNGGRLERFICPVCGAIFGPLKMLSLDQEQLADEYRQGYHTFSESNTTVLELDVFQSLGPSREGIYLNFGAGAWNKTTEQLRAEGFQVYDYEPYAPVDKKPWVFTTLEEASQFKYNGIFSNDLIEHLRTPGEDLKKMVSMMTDDGVMVHGSGCYDYAFEYTRFHLTFFTGSALEYLCRETGLGYELGERVNPVSPFRKCKFFRKTD